MSTTRIFGNTLRWMRGSLLFLVGLALALTIMFLFLNGIQQTALGRLLESMRLGMVIPAILIAALLFTCLFAIRVDDDSISHLFLRRFVLSRKPLADLRAVEIAGRWGAVLRFRDGSRIRFLGAHLEELREMARHLAQLRGGDVAISTGVAARGLLTVSDKLKRDA
jgi:hypothetical protein